MSNFTFEKYNELVNDINKLGDKLKSQNSDNYRSFATEDAACQLISIANSLQAYMRHYKRKLKTKI